MMNDCAFIFVLVALFLVVFVMMVRQNHLLMRSADKRLAMANEMVLKMAGSADMLAVSVSNLKDMMVHLEEVYTSRTDMVVKNRDEFREAYMKLLAKYEEMCEKYESVQRESFACLKEMARRPTITNT